MAEVIIPSHEETLSADLQIWTPHELVVCLLLIESAQMHEPQLPCEPGTDLLQPDSCCLTIVPEYVSIMAEENEITLIVECDTSSPFEIWSGWKQSSKLSSRSAT